MEARLGRKIELVHCSNSGAVLGHPDAWLDLVRPGIMIYGFYPDAGTPRSIPLLPGLSFHTRVSFLKPIKAGTQVGYGLTWTAPRDTWLAHPPGGLRGRLQTGCSRTGAGCSSAAARTRWWEGCAWTSAWSTWGPETSVQVGDPVVLIGRSGDEEITVDEWAKALGTISYEVTCQINARVERVFQGA